MTPVLETRSYAASQVRGVDVQKRRITVVISTYDLDSHGTRIDQAGWDFSVFKKNPVVPLAHDDRGYTGSNGLPVGKGLPDSIRVENQRTLMDIEFPPEGVFPLADTVFELARNGFINAVSVGFEPLDWEDVEEVDGEETKTVRIFRKQRLLEVSIVTIPSNSNALIQRAKKLGHEVEPFRAMAKQVEALAAGNDADPIRWNRALSSVFDVAGGNLPPSKVEYDWVAKYLGCEIKNVFHNSCTVPSVRLGGFLSGMRQALAGFQLEDTRKITKDGGESPPVYEVIQLNSRLRDDFLVDGMSFYKGDATKAVVKVSPGWFGLDVDVYSPRERKDVNIDLIDRAWEWARENNYLKGDAFSISGEFIHKTEETWDNVFLSEKNQKALQRAVDRLNEKQKTFPNRGIILMGPPGTGKTMSGRVIRNLAQATFIWISARDFHRLGGVGGMAYAFELAKEVAPSILFFEDIDNWLHPTAVDYLKTEMDGIARSSGVLTILTTNFPELLPEALIDRPGRFHDVLKIGLPDEKARTTMLQRWLPGLSDEDVTEALKKTKGYSGAHMYELAFFAKSLQESEELSLSEALREALKKIDEQRDLIDRTQLGGSKYKPYRMIGMRLEKNDGILASTMANAPETVQENAEEFEKYKSYFEKKQPANKASTKVLKKFFEKVLKEDIPEEEVKAWERMGEAVEALEEKPVEPEPKTEEIKPEEKAPEVTEVKEESVIQEEPKPEPKEEVPVVQEEAKETPPQPTPAPAPEAPEPEHKACVQIPFSSLRDLRKRVADVRDEALVKASREGVPAADWADFAEAAVTQYLGTLTHSH